jgi:hypothetical protein
VIVVPDHGGQCEYSLHHAGDDTAGCAPSVLFEVELPLEGLVDRLDDLPQRLEQGFAGALPFALAGWPQQLDALLGKFVFEGAAEVVLVADQRVAFPGEEVEGHRNEDRC